MSPADARHDASTVAARISAGLYRGHNDRGM